MREILTETVRRSGLREAYVEAVVTRGVPGLGERDPRLLAQRFYAYAIPYVWIVRPEIQERGTDVIVARETRRIPPDAVDPTVKNFHWGISSAASSRHTTAVRGSRFSPTAPGL